MLDQLYMQDLADAMKIPAEPLPTGKVTVSGPQVETQPKQPEMGTITGIPQTAFEKALETSGVKLSELGDMIDQSAPGTLNTLLGREVPIIGNLKLRDFLPFVGSKDDGKLTGTPAALIAAGTGQPLRGQPVVGSAIGPDGRTYFSASGSPAMLSEDVGTAVMDVATLGLGKPLAAGAKKAVKATKNLPVGMSTKAVGQGVDELGFYSAEKQAVDAIQQPKGTGEQFLKQIEKTPGVKPEEVKWTGLDDFLKSKKSVTKAEVQDYLDKNRVEVKEVQLGGAQPAPTFTQIEPDLWESNVGNIYKQSKDDFTFIVGGEGEMHYFNSFDEAANFAKEFSKTEAGKKFADNTKFSKYTLPGGENYREILLTLPQKPSKFELVDDKGIKMSSQFDNQADAQKFIDRFSVSGGMFEKNKPNIVAVGDKNAQFTSQHFDQPNILAHLRVNDRVDADGKKVLFVEEVQSDWHQAGRKKGYTSPEADKAKQAFADYSNELADKYDVNPAQNIAMYGTMKGIKPEEIAKYEQLQSAYTSIKDAVPDAPFKGNWHELAMKRAIQMASEGGYDRIAFTTGKTQAERFDLSKQIDELLVTKNPNGTFNLEATMPNGGGTRTVGEEIEADKLDDIVGKDLASMIRKQESKGDVYSADDLRVGGEGMKGFYDDILPKFLNKYAKKWDAKTGMTALITDDIKFQEFYNWALKKDKSKSYNSIQSSFKQKDNLYKEFAAESPIKGDEVHYIDITPKMRESVVTKGQPLFAVGAGGAGAAATQEENK